MAAPVLSRKALNLLYEIPTDQFICKELPSGANGYSSTYSADILVDEQPEYPDIPSSVWTVVLKSISNGQVFASIGPKDPTGIKSGDTVMVHWSVGLEGQVFDGRIESNAWVAAVVKTSTALSGLMTPILGHCGCQHYQLRKEVTVFVSMTFVVAKAARKDLELLQDSHMYSDCTLVCGKKKLPAHRAILAAQSPVFDAMFQHDMKEKSTGICKIDDIRAEVLETLVQYAYTRAPPKVNGTLQELWTAADKYDMKELRKDCERTMLQAVNPENAFKYMLFAEEHGLKKLRAEAAKCIYQQPV